MLRGALPALEATVEAESVPLSPAARTAIAGDPQPLASVLTGGDDDEVLFTAPRPPWSGSADVPPVPAKKMRLVQIAEEMVSVLTSEQNATLGLVVEIPAELPDGAGDGVKRAVSEDARTLNLESADWGYGIVRISSAVPGLMAVGPVLFWNGCARSRSAS